MKVAVIGAGAIGSVLAVYLRKDGFDVTLIGNKDQVKAISQNGLQINGTRGNGTFSIDIKEKLDQEYGLVIFSTKTQDLENAYNRNSKYLENCSVLTTQNGVQADNILSSHFEPEVMYSSIVMFGATYVNPGEVTLNFEGDWILGKPYTAIDSDTHDLAEILTNIFPVTVSENIMGMKWLKLFVNFNNCIPALIGKSMQETFSDMDLCRLSIHLLKEGVDVVKKADIEMVSLPKFPIDRIEGLVNMPIDQAAGIINQTLTKLSKEPLYGSILQSILRKRTSEIDFINGEVVHLAKQMRKTAPLNEKVVDLIHDIERNNQFLDAMKVKDIFNLN